MTRRLRILAFRLIAAALALLVLALGLAAIEFGSWGLLRLKGKTAERFGARYRRGPETAQYLPYIGYRYAPFAKDVRPGLDADRHGFIHNGDAGRDLSTKPDGLFRIFIVGGSNVAGNGQPHETIAAGLERRLNAQAGGSRRFEVVNAGASAWLASQELAMLTYYLADFQPDLVVTFNGFGDVYHAIRAPRERYHPNINQHLVNQSRAAFVHERSISGTLGQGVGMIKARSYAAEVLMQMGASLRARRGGEETAAAPAPLFPDPLGYYRRNMRLMFATARSLEVPLLAVLQPTLLASNSAGRAYREPLMAETASSWSSIDFWGEKDALYAEARSIFRGLAREFDDGRTGLVRDYSLLLDAEAEPSYIDQAHFTPAANAIIADALAADIQEFLTRAGG